ncbi:MAG: NAD-binding protein [Promethearchaeota archaeon]
MARELEDYHKRHSWLKIKIALKASKNYLFLVVAFFVGGFTYFLLAHTELSGLEVVAATFFAQGPTFQADSLATMYNIVGSLVITQYILAVVITRVGQAYNPTIVSLNLARHIEDHIVVVGYNHLGKRILKWGLEKGVPVVVVDKALDKVDDLVSAGLPVVVGEVMAPNVLANASVNRARHIVLTFNDVRTAMLLAHEIKKHDLEVKIHARCLDDHVSHVLNDLGAHPFSTSQWILESLVDSLPPEGARVLLVGTGHLAWRFIRHFQREGRPFVVVEKREERVEELREEGVKVVLGDATSEKALVQADIGKCEAAFVCIEHHLEETMVMIRKMRKLNPGLTIRVRAFDEELTGVLQELGGVPFSQSRSAFDKLVHDLES